MQHRQAQDEKPASWCLLAKTRKAYGIHSSPRTTCFETRELEERIAQPRSALDCKPRCEFQDLRAYLSHIQRKHRSIRHYRKSLYRSVRTRAPPSYVCDSSLPSLDTGTRVEGTYRGTSCRNESEYYRHRSSIPSRLPRDFPRRS